MLGTRHKELIWWLPKLGSHFHPLPLSVLFFLHLSKWSKDKHSAISSLQHTNIHRPDVQSFVPDKKVKIINVIANTAKLVIEVLLPPAVRGRQGHRRGISEPALGSRAGWTCLGQRPRELAHVDMDELLYWELLNLSLKLCPAIPHGFRKENSGFWMDSSFTSLAFGLANVTLSYQ